MHKSFLLISSLVLAVSPAFAEKPSSALSSASTPESTTAAAVAAGRAFLATFDAVSRPKVQFAFVAKKSGTLIRFRRTTPDQPVAPVTDEQAKAPVKRGPGMGPPEGFIGEQYGVGVWSNYPVSDVLRPGLQMGQLTPEQKAAAFHLLQTLLSAKGYQKVQDIMGADQALSETETHFASGQAVYTIAILGEPSETTPGWCSSGATIWA